MSDRRCACGELIKCPNDNRCEDCFADAQQRYDGKSNRVNTQYRPELCQPQSTPCPKPTKSSPKQSPKSSPK